MPKVTPKPETCPSNRVNSNSEHNDHSVCTTWGRTEDDRYFLLDLDRAKLTFPQLVERVRALHVLHRPSVIVVEDSTGSAGLIQSLRQGTALPISAKKPQADKLTRLNLLTGLIESGRVVLPCDPPWIDDLLLEITRFPRARHDDQVDSFTQGLTYLRDAMRWEFW